MATATVVKKPLGKAKFIGKAYTVDNLGMTFEESISAFIRSRKTGTAGATKVATDKTVYEYNYDLKKFFAFVRERGRKFYNQITEADVREFIDFYQARDLSASSKSKVFRTLRTFFRWIDLDSECKNEKMAGWAKALPKIANNARRTWIPTEEEMTTFLDGYDTDLMWELRDFTITCLILDCGARAGEICNLKPEDILWEQGQAILNGKTGKRIVPVDTDRTLPMLKKWMRIRESFAKCDFVFVTKYGGQCNPVQLDHAFAKHRERCGVISKEGALSPHTVRHYFCTHYLVNGGTLQGLQAITGHTSMETLQIYLHIAQQLTFVKQEHAKASPLKSLRQNSGLKKKRKMY